MWELQCAAAALLFATRAVLNSCVCGAVLPKGTPDKSEGERSACNTPRTKEGGEEKGDMKKMYF